MKQANKNLELLQWCMDNESEEFKISYTFNHGKSWIHALGGYLTFNCVDESMVDDVITELNQAKAKNTPEVVKGRLKAELLKRLAELEGDND